jgi:hypothetical protein
MDQEAFLSLEQQKKLRLLNRAGHILTSTHDMEALVACFLEIAHNCWRRKDRQPGDTLHKWVA